MTTTTMLIASAFAAALSLAVANGHKGCMRRSMRDKCFGIAKAGEDQRLGLTNSPNRDAVKQGGVETWLGFPAGTCRQITYGILTATTLKEEPHDNAV